jgi:hypothetical protein
VLIGYFGFFLNKEIVPARISLCTVTILITITLINNVYDQVPQLKYNTWLVKYCIGTLLFTIIPMLEFATLNFATVCHAIMRASVDTKVEEI